MRCGWSSSRVRRLLSKKKSKSLITLMITPPNLLATTKLGKMTPFHWTMPHSCRTLASSHNHAHNPFDGCSQKPPPWASTTRASRLRGFLLCALQSAMVKSLFLAKSSTHRASQAFLFLLFALPRHPGVGAVVVRFLLAPWAGAVLQSHTAQSAHMTQADTSAQPVQARPRSPALRRASTTKVGVSESEPLQLTRRYTHAIYLPDQLSVGCWNGPS